MLYEELPLKERQALDQFMSILRPTCGELARLCQRVDVLKLQWDVNISAIVAQIDANAAVADPTGLAGAIPMEAGAIVAVIANLDTLLQTFNKTEDRTGYAKAAGAINLIG